MTIRAIFMGRVLARISILPKISRFWLFCSVCTVQVDHCVTFMRYAIESSADGSLCFRIALTPTLVSFWSVRSSTSNHKHTNKHVCIFASLWTFSVDLTFSVLWLVDYVQYLHVIGQTTLDVLGNIKILARTCPVWTAHVATLLILSKAAFMLSKIQ